MIDRTQIETLTPRGRTQLFDDLSGALFRTQGDCATALEVSTKTIQNWRNADTVPIMAVYALHSLAEAKLGRELAEVVAGLERIASILAQLIPSAVSRETPGNAGKNSSALPAGAGSGKSARA
jgi:hypothetical protein